jgi:threonine aldolase
MIGGGMRQVGIIVAAGLVALRTMINRLKEDHDSAHRLAQGLAHFPGITVIRPEISTNIVMFELSANIPASNFVERLNNRGVKVGYRGGQRCRAVTHRMINIADIDEALNRIEAGVKEISG